MWERQTHETITLIQIEFNVFSIQYTREFSWTVKNIMSTTYTRDSYNIHKHILFILCSTTKNITFSIKFLFHSIVAITSKSEIVPVDSAVRFSREWLYI